MEKIDLIGLRAQANSFLTKVFRQLERAQVVLERHWYIDHLCYRTSTLESYLFLKKEFSKFSDLLIESEVNGRMISTFKLARPIIFGDWEIELIELPAPKKNKPVNDGFEHLEVVCDVPFEEIKNLYGQLQIDETGLAKSFNQELEIVFDGFALKFHHLSLESVVNLESNLLVYSAIEKSNILAALKQFNPLIAGTFPLNIHTDSSDVDILIAFNDFGLAPSAVESKLGYLPGFKCRKITVEGEQTLIANFTYDGVDFEVFGQNIAAIRQRGYRHFLVEERLLKIGGLKFKAEVLKFKEQGLKTEPAFAKALGLKNDPYAELLSLQKKSNQDLKKMFQK